MKLTILLLLGCMALSCLAFPTRDIRPIDDPDEDNIDDGLIPERERPEQFRRRRSAQMNPGQDQPSSTTEQPQPMENSGSQGKMSEGTRQRRDGETMGDSHSHSNERETTLEPPSPMPVERMPRRRRQMSQGESTTEQPSSTTEQQQPMENSGSQGKMSEGTRQRRHDTGHSHSHSNEDETTMGPTTAMPEDEVPRRRRQMSQGESTTEQPSSTTEQQQPMENSGSQGKMSEGTRQRRHDTGHSHSHSNEDETTMGPTTAQPEVQTLRRRRAADVDMAPAVPTDPDLGQPLTEDRIPDTSSEEERSKPEGETLESTSERPLVEGDDKEIGMKPVDARRRRSAQAEIAPVLLHQSQQQTDLTTTEQPLPTDDSSDGQAQGMRRRRHDQSQMGQGSESTTQQPSTSTSDSNGQQQSQGMRYKRQKQPGGGYLPQTNNERPSVASPPSTDQSTTEEPMTQRVMAPETRKRRNTDMASEMNQQQSQMTTEQPSSSTDGQSSQSTTEMSSTQAPGETMQETRRRRHSPQGPGSSGQSEGVSEMPATDSPRVVPGGRRRRNTPMEQGTSEQQPESTSEMPSTQPSDMENSQGMRSRRDSQIAMMPEMRHNLEMTTELPTAAMNDKSSQSSESNEMLTTEAPGEVMPETRRRRHVPIRFGTSEPTSTDAPATLAPDMGKSDGIRKRRSAQERPSMGMPLGDTTEQPPIDEDENRGSHYTRMTTTDPDDLEGNTTEHPDDSPLTEETDKTTEVSGESSFDRSFWQRKARLWGHLW